MLSGRKTRQVFPFLVGLHSNDGCHGGHRHWPREEKPLPTSASRSSRAAEFFPPHFIWLKPLLSSNAERRRTLLVGILLALHLALLLCSIWSQACIILRRIFSSEESSIKGVLIIHDARFRFVPRCSETEFFPQCYFAEQMWIGAFPPSSSMHNFLPRMIYRWSHTILLWM